MRRSVQRNAASDYVRIATEPFLPEDFRDHRHVGALFFFRPKIPTEDRTDAKDVEIVRRHSPAEDLDGVAHARESEREYILASEAVKESLSFTVMLKARRGDRDIDQITRLIASEQVDDTRRLLERQAAQEQIVYQTEDCCVRTDGERERNHGDDGEPWRFSQRPERVFEVGDHKDLSELDCT